MAVIYDNTNGNNALDQLCTWGATPKMQIWSGAVPGTLAATPAGTKLAVLTLVPAAAASKSKDCKGASAVSNAAVAAGTATFYRVTNSAESTVYEQGTLGTSGTDATIDNTNIAVGQTVSLTGFTKTI